MGPPEVLARPFVAPRTAYGAGHRGVDLATRVGAEVRAVEGGVVTHAGVIAGRGTVSVRHRGGLRSTYEPLEIARGLRVGDAVEVGSRLGTVAAGGHCRPGVCLHLAAVLGDGRPVRYLDPMLLLRRPSLILLPVRGP